MSRWPKTRLGDVLTRVERFEERREEIDYPFAGTYSFARGLFDSGIKPGAGFKLPRVQRIHAGDFVYCKIMAWEGAFGVVPTNLDGHVLSGAFVSYEIDTNSVDPQYLSWYFKVPAVWQSIGSASTGTNIRRRSLHPSVLESHRMPLPPIEEQRRVAEKLNRLAASVERVAGLVRTATSISGVASRSVFDAAMNTDTHKVVPLGEIATKITKGTTPKTYGFTFANEGVPFLRAEEVGGGLVEWQQTPFFLPPEANQFMSRSRTQAGDVLVTIAGTIGRSAVVPVEAPQLNVNQAVAVVRLVAGVIPEYVSAFVRSPQGQDYLVGRTVESAISNVSLKTLRQMPVPVPSIDQQGRVVERVRRAGEGTDGVARRRGAVVKELSAVLASALQRAMS